MPQPALTRSEEDHIKAIHTLSAVHSKASTNAISERLSTKASSVTDMLKKLADKGLVKHEPYHGVRLTTKGQVLALHLVRKHRLWETFLVERLHFGWAEVHEVAEQLEHIVSDKLIDRLDDHLGNPAFDPHGDPIPDSAGRVRERKTKPLASCNAGDRVRIAWVGESNDELLHLLSEKGLRLGSVLTLETVHAFDGSLDLRVRAGGHLTLSAQVAAHLHVEHIAS